MQQALCSPALKRRHKLCPPLAATRRHCPNACLSSRQSSSSSHGTQSQPQQRAETQPEPRAAVSWVGLRGAPMAVGDCGRTGCSRQGCCMSPRFP